MSDSVFRQLPSVSQLLDSPALAVVRQETPHTVLLEAIRQELSAIRQQLRQNQANPPDLDTIVNGVQVRVVSSQQLQLRRVINATGIVLHTNLGRSPMHETAAQAAYMAARGYLNLEMSLESGVRSSRQNPIRAGVCRITGAEAATVVNNCAAATVIVLRALAMGKEVIVSRGQLIEIGGSFRIPDIMTVSGATLKEVGTTNITRIRDYENAIGPNTGLLMRIHTSNYRIRGFTETPTMEELVALGQKHNIPVVDDAGSGAVLDLAPYGLAGEPVIHEGIRAGADLVLFSGDKLLGGPQAGIIAGKKNWIEAIERDPLMRAFRLDKMTLAALEATLQLYVDLDHARQQIPTLKLLTMPLTELRQRAEQFASRLLEIGSITDVAVQDDVAYVGGGSLPDEAVPTVIVACRSTVHSEDTFAKKLRLGAPAVVARVQAGLLMFDLRTVFVEQEAELLHAIQIASGE